MSEWRSKQVEYYHKIKSIKSCISLVTYMIIILVTFFGAIKNGYFKNKMKINQINHKNTHLQHRHSLFKPKLRENWTRWCANQPAAFNWRRSYLLTHGGMSRTMLCNAALVVRLSNFYSSFKPNFSRIFFRFSSCSKIKLFDYRGFTVYFW